MLESIVKRNIRDLDYTLIGVMIGISIFSCVAIYTSTYGKADPNTGNAVLGIPPHILWRQIILEVVSYGMMVTMFFMDYKSLAKWRWWLLGIAMFLLVVVFAFHRVNGAHSWIPLPGLSFQPSELAKIAVIVWTASYMDRMNAREHPDRSIKGLLPIFMVFFVSFSLILIEPALGQALVLLAIMYTMLMVYVQRRHMVMMVGAGLAVLLVMVLSVGVFPNQSINFLTHQHFLSHYQTNRLISFIEPGYQPQYSGYQVHEAEIAVGAGGVFGTGLFRGSQTMGGFVPAQWTDFIFSAVAEQLGFVGSSVLIMLFLIMLYRMIKVGMTALDDFGSYMIAGFVGMFTFQIVENIGMNLVISPVTGITLPFVSYGGSSLIVNFISIGIVLSISIRRRTLRFD